MKILYSGQKIYDLIPQRPPMVMIDTVYESDDKTICTSLTVMEDNIFVSGTHLEEAGLIEHIAQTAAALAGYETAARGLPPELGYIGEAKNFECRCLPAVGETVRTRMEVVAKMADVTLVQAETSLDNTLAATCQMKIFIQKSN